MKKNLMTTIFGALAGAAALFHSQGITLGHLGNGDVISLLQGIFTAAFGAYAADAGKPTPTN